MSDLLQDLRYAARTLLRSRGFTAAAVLTLALGIGVNTGVFSILNGIVLRPHPFPEPEQLAYVGWDFGTGTALFQTAYKFDYIREHNQVFEGVHTMMPLAAELRTDGQSTEVSGMSVSEDFFIVNRIQPRLGRGFMAEEDRPGGARVVVLSDELWRSRFSADPDVLGTDVQLDGVSHTVIGVMPEGFSLPEHAGALDILVPLRLESDPRDSGTNYFVRSRIRSGMSPEQVQADLLSVSQQFKQEHPDLLASDESGVGATLYDYRDLMRMEGLSGALWILLGAVGVVLLIACVNVANLLLARSADRQREMAIRAAIGAGRGRLARQLLTESLLLALIAAVIGMLLGQWSVDALLALAPADLPRADEIGLDARVLLFTLGIGVATGVAFGMTAALHAWKGDLNSALREGGARQSASRGGLRLRSAFVSVQAAFSVVLLTGAGLLITSFIQLQKVDLGFEPDGLLAVSFPRTPTEYAGEGQGWRFNQELLGRLRALPGVSSAATATALPFGGQFNISMTVVGRPEATRGDVQWRSISPGYFETLGTELVAGRDFSEADDTRTQPVMIVDETFVRKYFGDDDPIGQRVALGTVGGEAIIPDFDDGERVIVGVVADARTLSLSDGAEETMYTPRAQEPFLPDFVEFLGLGGLLVRTSGAGPGMSNLLATIQEIDPLLPEPRFITVNEAIGNSIAGERFIMVLLSGIAGLALVLTTVGIYGVVAYTVRQRTGEIGVRIALGASPGGVLGLVLRQGLTPVLVGLGLGLVATIAITRIIASLLYGVSPTDPLTLAGVVAIIAGVAALATWLPARRAAGVDPVVALKAE